AVVMKRKRNRACSALTHVVVRGGSDGRRRAASGDRGFDEVQAPSAIDAATGVVGGLIKVETPGALREGSQIDAARGRSRGSSVERERTGRCGALKRCWEGEERASGV